MSAQMEIMQFNQVTLIPTVNVCVYTGGNPTLCTSLQVCIKKCFLGTIITKSLARIVPRSSDDRGDRLSQQSNHSGFKKKKKEKKTSLSICPFTVSQYSTSFLNKSQGLQRAKQNTEGSFSTQLQESKQLRSCSLWALQDSFVAVINI